MSRAWPTVLLALIVAHPLAAQGRPIELGVDAGFGFKLNEPKVTTIGLPVASFRAGFFVSDQISIEPVVNLSYLKYPDEDAFYTYGAELGALYHFTKDASKSRAFFHPLAGVNVVGGGGDSESQFHAGLGLGVKAPIANRLAFRLEVQYYHGFETSGIAAGDHLALLLGLSFFTK
jgi:hypothetical protein